MAVSHITQDGLAFTRGNETAPHTGDVRTVTQPGNETSMNPKFFYGNWIAEWIPIADGAYQDGIYRVERLGMLPWYHSSLREFVMFVDKQEGEQQ